MAMARHVLLTLLALVLILPAGFVLSPAAVAEDEQPGEGAEALYLVETPWVAGSYLAQFSATTIWADGNKMRWSGEFVILIQQFENIVWVLWGPAGTSDMAQARAKNSEPPEKAPSWVWPVGLNGNGWVGHMLVDPDSGKPKNKPPLTAALFDIQNAAKGGYGVSNLTAIVKLDKDQKVKSIKGTISESNWLGEYYTNAKFTAKPVPALPGEVGLPPGVELLPRLKLPQKSE